MPNFYLAEKADLPSTLYNSENEARTATRSMQDGIVLVVAGAERKEDEGLLRKWFVMERTKFISAAWSTQRASSYAAIERQIRPGAYPIIVQLAN